MTTMTIQAAAAHLNRAPPAAHTIQTARRRAIRCLPVMIRTWITK